MDGSGTILATNTFGAQGLVSRHTTATNASVFYTYDERGNVVQRLDGTGSVLSTDLYDAYGARTSTAVQSDPWGFGAQWGYQTDAETGLLLLTNRYYDPAAGRFVTRDPIGYAGGVNLYGYTKNNPGNESDPSGLMPPFALAGGGILTGGATVSAGGTTVAAIFWPVAAVTAAGAAGYALGTAATALGNHIANGIHAQEGLPASIIAYKPYNPNQTLPRDQHGRSIPSSPYPHTQLGERAGRKCTYPQAREWGQDGQPGRPVRDVDWTNHGRPGAPGHTIPHEHPYGPGGEHLPAQPLNPDGTNP
jgi:RHS repeat-associated protein